jgi:pantothenate kinase
LTDVREIAEAIRARAGTKSRFMIAIVGPPGAGKSTVSAALRDALLAMGEKAVVVPMDGYHFDDIILNAIGHRPRKGAPYTFDVGGLESILKRIRAGEPDVAIPVFDRHMELSRNAADIVESSSRFILIEGNYLLLKESPWNRLKPLFDYSIYLDVPVAELERRLTKRIMEHGHDLAYAKNWIASNDLLNIRYVVENSDKADLTVQALVPGAS